MSLKAFHIFFIVVSVITAFGFAAWGMIEFSTQGGMPNLLMGIFSLLAGVALIVYGVRFLRKFRNIGYL